MLIYIEVSLQLVEVSPVGGLGRRVRGPQPSL
jgi:hypothetical protein